MCLQYKNDSTHHYSLDGQTLFFKFRQQKTHLLELPKSRHGFLTEFLSNRTVWWVASAARDLPMLYFCQCCFYGVYFNSCLSFDCLVSCWPQ